MTSVLLLQCPDPAAPDLAADFTAAGFTLCGQGDCAHLVREALRTQPDVVVCWAPRIDDELLQAMATLDREQSMPLLVFTRDGDVDRLRTALEAGVDAWVVQGYGAHRLRPLVALAQARHAHGLALRRRVAELEAQLNERKLVDRAKGILMRSRQLSEDEAFRLLRNTSMQGNRRVGQVSQQVIETARLAEAINRAGQQRMLSQRLVKLYALACSRTDRTAATLLMRETIARVDENLALLERELSPATFGDLLAAGRQAWDALRRQLEAGHPSTAELPALDALAETVLAQAEALVRALEASGVATTLGVVNLAGRQRMLSQRAAKLALIPPGPERSVRGELDAAMRAFEDGLRALEAAPLSTPAIRELLQQGGQAWQQLRQAAARADQAGGRMAVGAASEELLTIFDRLTQAYQDSMEVLLA